MSITLNRDEARVLGVLVEKALTTPAQYPLSVNAVVTGSNQRSNREPVMQLSEESAYDALDALRAKGLAREVDMSGSRVTKYRHVARETLGVETPGLVVLVELLLRGPQTPGELRGRASRMQSLDSVDEVERLLQELASREPAMVQRLEREPGARAARWVQLVSPGLHPIDARPTVAETPSQAPASAQPSGLEARVAALETEVAALRERLARLTSGA